MSAHPLPGSFRPGPAWVQQVWTANRQQLASASPPGSWKTAALALGVAWSHQAGGSADDLAALQTCLDRSLTKSGSWLIPPDRVEHALLGLPLLYLWEFTGEERYLIAARKLANMLLHAHVRTEEGTLPYNPATGELMVDALGMLAPFLTRYARLADEPAARDLAVHQLQCFITQSVDPQTGLPYHGYYAGGPYRLGLHAWGRGVGWYLFGLVETLHELPEDHPDCAALAAAFIRAAQAMLACQREDGQWSWAVLQRLEPFDSSTTAMAGFSFLRGVQMGLLDRHFFQAVGRSLEALARVTREDGELDGSLAECEGMGKYPQNFGPTPWLQGFASAFLSAAYRPADSWIGLEKDTMNIVITGITSFRNRGVAALVVSTVEQLRCRWSAANITVLTNTPEYDALALPGVRFLKTDLRVFTGRRFRLKRSLSRLVGRDLIAEPRTKAAEALRTASLVIALGGDVFSSDYGDLSDYLLPLEYAQRHNVPVIMLGHSIGPFRHAQEVQAFTRVARRCPIITVREPLSYEYVTRDLELDPSRVWAAADPAFLLAPADFSRSMLCSIGLDPLLPIVSLSVSQGISTFSGVSAEKHLAAWVDLVGGWLRADPQVQFLLIPHVQEDRAAIDDRIIATQLLKALGFDPRVRLAGGDYTASEFKGLINASQMVIAERMHAGIAGLSNGVCSVLVGYSVKARGVLLDLLGPQAEAQGLLVPIQDFVAGDQLARMLSIWQRREDVAAELRRSLPGIKERAALNFDLLQKILN